MVLWPVCYDNHWILVAAFNLGSSPILGVLDSMRWTWSRVTENISAYLYEEQRAKHMQSTISDDVNFEMKVVYLQTRRQKNGYDCGIFLLAHTEKLLSRYVVK